MTSTEDMPWGSLPLERFVLAKWASLAYDNLNERRRQLARQYTAIGRRGRVLHVARSVSQSDLEQPPQADWEGILAPLRTDFQRQLASPYSFQPLGSPCWGIIWLRTCYDEGTNEAHQGLLKKLNLDLGIEVKENILNDSTLYSFGDDWHRVFEILPERLFGETLDRMLHNAEATTEDIEAPIREAQRDLTIDRVTDIDGFKQATEELHSDIIYSYIFVSDKVALDTGKVLIVFFDDCGRTVRQSRLLPDHCEDIAGAWSDCFIDEMDVFTEADIGPDYLPGRLCGPPYET